MLGESEHTSPASKLAPVAPRSDHQAGGFLGFWLCHPPVFEGGLDRSTTTAWLRMIEEIPDAKEYCDAKKDTPITWEHLRTSFLESSHGAWEKPWRGVPARPMEMFLLFLTGTHGKGLPEEEDRDPNFELKGRSSSLGSKVYQDRKWNA
ncbi:hypothetical protein SESBI_05837, partial [Sesbania bispinosa]